MDEEEVYHTILLRAISECHSPFKKDIMYTPHQKGIVHVGDGDRLSVNWLYTFPQGKTVAEIASKYGVSGMIWMKLLPELYQNRQKRNLKR